MFHYVYILTSITHADRHYIGYTKDLDKQLAKHNNGEVKHISKYKPWKIQTVIAFDTKEKTLYFEKYLKSHSGRAFAKKHF